MSAIFGTFLAFVGALQAPSGKKGGPKLQFKGCYIKIG